MKVSFSVVLLALLLVATASAAGSCKASADCEGRAQCVSGTCKTIPLFSDFNYRDILVSIACFLAATLAAGAGLGGGGILVPLFILVGGFSAHEAVPLSQALMAGGGVMNFILYYQAKHPFDPLRPVIDYDAVVMLEPLMLAGTIVGVFLNKLFPSWLIVVCLLLVLVYSIYRTGRKGMRIRRAEQQAAMQVADNGGEGEKDGEAAAVEGGEAAAAEGGEAAKAEEEGADTAGVAVVVDGDDGLNGDAASGGEGGGDKAADPVREALILRSHGQVKSIGVIFLILIIVAVLSLMRGGKAGAVSLIGINPCTGPYWGLTAATFVILMLITVLFAVLLNRRHIEKVAHEFPYLEGDILWTRQNVSRYPAFATFAGMAGGLLGIGGGMIMGPLMLELGMLPEPVKATGAITVFLTSASTTAQFLVLDLLLWQRGIWFFSIGVISAILGQTTINHVVKKYKSASLIVLVIVTVMFLSTLMMVIVGILRVTEDVQKGNSLGFRPIC